MGKNIKKCQLLLYNWPSEKYINAQKKNKVKKIFVQNKETKTNKKFFITLVNVPIATHPMDVD